MRPYPRNRDPEEPASSTRPRPFGAAGLIWLLGCLLALAGCDAVAGDESLGRADSNPLSPLRGGHANVIVVSFDALRADALGAYGSRRGATPHIDQFARESIVFENAYTASSITPTSFAAVFSGMLPMKVFHQWRFNAPASLAELFSRAGYRTGAFLNNVQLTAERGFGRGFDEYRWHMNAPDDEVLDGALAWWREEGSSRRPRFLWIHLLRPHAPYRFYPEAQHLYRDTSYEGPFTRTTGVKFTASSARDVARIEDLYAGEVWMADRSFGRVVDWLRRKELLDSSIVVLTADHGEEFQEHGRFQHSGLYEEHLRIPLIIRHPKAAGGMRVAHRVRSIDLMPTLLGMIGEPHDQPVDGVDLSSPDAPRERPVVAAITTAQVMVSIRSGDEKLIVTCHPEVGLELYDLASDPGERVDVAGRRQRTVRRLVRELSEQLGGNPCRAANLARRDWERSEVSPETLEALRALGYVG